MDEDWLSDLLIVPNAQAEVVTVSRHLQANLPRPGPNRGRAPHYVTPQRLRKAQAERAAELALSVVVAPKVEAVEEETATEDVSSDASCDNKPDSSVALAKPDMSWDASVSCVPPGATWVTKMDPPKRERRTIRPVRRAGESSDEPASESLRVAKRRGTNDSNSSSSRGSSRTASRGMSPTAMDDAPKVPPPPTADLLRRRGSAEGTKQSGKRGHSDALSSSGSVEPHEDVEDVLALAPDPKSRKVLRHNLTERRRVDRLNQRFKKVCARARPCLLCRARANGPCSCTGPAACRAATYASCHPQFHKFFFCRSRACSCMTSSRTRRPPSPWMATTPMTCG